MIARLDVAIIGADEESLAIGRDLVRRGREVLVFDARHSLGVLERSARSFGVPLALDEPIIEWAREDDMFVLRTAYAGYQARCLVLGGEHG